MSHTLISGSRFKAKVIESIELELTFSQSNSIPIKNLEITIDLHKVCDAISITTFSINSKITRTGISLHPIVSQSSGPKVELSDFAIDRSQMGT